jgi:Ca-activated chloride channel family protein
MGGDSIASARRALLGVAQGLTQEDEVSLTRFGTSSELVMPPQRCTHQALKSLGEAVEATDASLGGTQMEAALLGVFALPSWLQPTTSAKLSQSQSDKGAAAQAGCADVLLITDGEVWDTQRMIASAQRSGHRVFVIGVGSSPAEAVLRHLAEATGGACEFATPGEALEAAAGRMLQRMRQSVWTGLRVDWGTTGTPQWELPAPKRAFGGDTLLSLAGIDKAGVSPGASDLPGSQEVRLMARGADGQEVEIGRVCTVAEASGDDLPRIAAARRVAALDALTNQDPRTLWNQDEVEQEQAKLDQAQALAPALALEHRLVSRHTHAVLVHRRDEADKPEDESLLHRVQSMLAAGWGNSGRVAKSPAKTLMASTISMPLGVDMNARRSVASPAACYRISTPSLWRSARVSTPTLAADAMDYIEIPAFLRKQADPEVFAQAQIAVAQYTSLAEISGAVADHLARGGLVEDLPSVVSGFEVDPAMKGAYTQALAELRALTPEEPLVWLLLALWIAQRPAPDGSPAMAAVLVGPVTAAGLIPTNIGRAWQILERYLGAVPSQTRPVTKPGLLRRLAAALSGSGG